MPLQNASMPAPVHLIDRMCRTNNHGFALLPAALQDAHRLIMRQLWEHDIAPYIESLFGAAATSIPETAVAPCGQCEAEGFYADSVDSDACSTECTRCRSNGWIVDLPAIITSLKAHGAPALPCALSSSEPCAIRQIEWVESSEGFWTADDFTGGRFEIMQLSDEKYVCQHVFKGSGLTIGDEFSDRATAEKAAQENQIDRLSKTLIPSRRAA